MGISRFCRILWIFTVHSQRFIKLNRFQLGKRYDFFYHQKENVFCHLNFAKNSKSEVSGIAYYFTRLFLNMNQQSLNIALPTYDEKDLVKACIRKERWAQKILYEMHYGKMMGVCLRYSNHQEDALDILHEGFIKVFKNLGKYELGTSLSAWIRRIMVNTAIDFYRKNVRRRTEDIDQAYDLSSSEPSAISKMTTDEILTCVQKLSPAYRAVFNLYVIEGYSHREIADLLGITESTSRSNLVKARLKLKEALIAKQKDYGNREK